MLDRRHEIRGHALRERGYEVIAGSEVLPALELGWLATFLSSQSQSQAVRALRAAMRSHR